MEMLKSILNTEAVWGCYFIMCSKPSVLIPVSQFHTQQVLTANQYTLFGFSLRTSKFVLNWKQFIPCKLQSTTVLLGLLAKIVHLSLA